MTTTNRPLRVFLCHSSNDKPAVRELYQKLHAEAWIQPWLDEEELHPGQTWEMEIEKAVEASDVVLVCLSNSSINKRGYVQKELRFALDIALEMPEETIFIIPLRLEECTPPRSLREWQYANYFEGQRDRALERLLVSLKRRAEALGLALQSPIQQLKPTVKKTEEIMPSPVLVKTPSAWIGNIGKGFKETIVNKADSKTKQTLPTWLENYTNEINKMTSSMLNKITLSNGIEFIRVSAGEFIMGSDNGRSDEKPQHTVDIPYDYWIARYRITNDLYNAYASAKEIKHPIDDWEKIKNHPAVFIKWTDAMGYCQWLSSLLNSELPSGFVLRLPTESEWEKAARGVDGREFPWGNTFDTNKCNTVSGKGNTSPVGLYSPGGDSPYGCADMAGNVWEWTNSLKKEYPYKIDDGRENRKISGPRVLRGGSFFYPQVYSRCALRHCFEINTLNHYYGFRIVLAPKLPK